jgi:hypothetical protein
VDAPSATANGQIVIGNLIFGTGATGTGTTIAGAVGIGLNNPSHVLHISGAGRSTQAAWDTSSDRRVKKSIKKLEGGLDTILRLNPVSFEYTDEYKAGKNGLDGLRRGFIAQEVEPVIPEMVKIVDEKFGDKEIKDFRLLTNSDFVPLLVKAVQELNAENEKMRAEFQADHDKLRAEFEAYRENHTCVTTVDD